LEELEATRVASGGGHVMALISARAVGGLALIAALLSLRPAPSPAAETGPFTLAVPPAAPPVVTHTLWTPFVERLGRETGLSFRLTVYEKMSDFERAISLGTPDFLLASPLQAVVAHEAQGYVPLVRGGALVSAEVFVRWDSPIRTVDDLAQRRIAFVGSKSLCTLLVKDLIARRHSPAWREQAYTGSTDNVIKSVLLEKADAGAAFVPDVERAPREIRDQLRTIFETPRVPPHPLCAHPRVPAPVREAVTKAVLAIATTQEGAELLATIRLPAPVAADYGRDYRSLERIDVKGLAKWGE
jgi:phosphonate transport system substrate-binding protein